MREDWYRRFPNIQSSAAMLKWKSGSKSRWSYCSGRWSDYWKRCHSHNLKSIKCYCVGSYRNRYRRDRSESLNGDATLPGWGIVGSADKNWKENSSKSCGGEGELHDWKLEKRKNVKRLTGRTQMESSGRLISKLTKAEEIFASCNILNLGIHHQNHCEVST